MKALKVMGRIDEQGKLTLDQPLITDKNSRVEVIFLISEETDQDNTSKSKYYQISGKLGMK